MTVPFPGALRRLPVSQEGARPPPLPLPFASPWGCEAGARTGTPWPVNQCGSGPAPAGHIPTTHSGGQRRLPSNISWRIFKTRSPAVPDRCPGAPRSSCPPSAGKVLTWTGTRIWPSTVGGRSPPGRCRGNRWDRKDLEGHGDPPARLGKSTSPDKSGMASGREGNDHPEVIFDRHDPSHRQ